MKQPARKGYIPDRGDLVWISFTPQAGHEQAGRRPGLVLSPKSYNGKVGLALICPVTNQAKGYPFEVALPEHLQITGVVLADQARSLDWRVRKAEKGDTAPAEIIEEVTGRIVALLTEDG